MRKSRLVLALLAVAGLALACSAPNEPRIPSSGKEPKQPPPDGQGYQVGTVTFASTATV